jgi:hypothetical protein
MAAALFFQTFRQERSLCLPFHSLNWSYYQHLSFWANRSRNIGKEAGLIKLYFLGIQFIGALLLEGTLCSWWSYSSISDDGQSMLIYTIKVEGIENFSHPRNVECMGVGHS